jgi:large subunit ribosomal protein L21e
MVRSSKGLRKRTRRKLKKGMRDKFKPGNVIQEFKSGDKVIISINPSSQKGMPYIRFKGKSGIVKNKRGNAFVINVIIGKKKREIHVNPEHMKKT